MRPHILPLQLKNSPNSSFFFCPCCCKKKVGPCRGQRCTVFPSSPPRPVRLAYQPPASNTFLLEQINHQQPTNSTFLSEQTSISHQTTEQARRRRAPEGRAWLAIMNSRGRCVHTCTDPCGSAWTSATRPRTEHHLRRALRLLAPCSIALRQ
jgi:hypothetical protein